MVCVYIWWHIISIIQGNISKPKMKKWKLTHTLHGQKLSVRFYPRGGGRAEPRGGRHQQVPHQLAQGVLQQDQTVAHSQVINSHTVTPSHCQAGAFIYSTVSLETCPL